jgi:hypothetical protein
MLKSRETAPLKLAVLQVVIEYEQGKAIPNQQILAKMERALGKFTAQCVAN